MSIRFPNRVAQQGTYHAQDGSIPAYIELDGDALTGMRLFSDVGFSDEDIVGTSIVSVADATIWAVHTSTWRASDSALVIGVAETASSGSLTDLETVEVTACATESVLTAAYGGCIRVNSGSYLAAASSIHFTLDGETAPTPAFGVIYATANDLGVIEQAYLGPGNWSDLSAPVLSWETENYWLFNLSGTETIELEPISSARNARQFAASIAVDLYIPASAPSGAQSIYLYCGEHGAPEGWGSTGESVGSSYTVGVATTVTLHCAMSNVYNVFLKGLDTAIANGYRITNIVFSSASV